MTNAFISYSSQILADSNKGFTGSEIVKRFVEYSVKFNKPIPFHNNVFTKDGKLIPKREAFRMNLESFSDEEKYFIIDDLCTDQIFTGSNEVLGLRIKLQNDFSNLDMINTENDELDLEILDKTKHLLDDFPEIKTLYDKAINNYKLKYFERSVLDDMRLCLELLLKKIFNNNKSLENQISEIGNFVTKKGGSIEFTNMFQKLIDYYSKYQNSYIKHNDKVNKQEVEFIIEMSSLFMKNIMKLRNSI